MQIIFTFSLLISHFLNNGFSVCALYITQKYLHIAIDTNVTYTMPPISSILVTVLIALNGFLKK